MPLRIAVITLLIFLSAVQANASFSPNDVEWGDGVSATLYKDGTLTNGEYMIKAVDFPAAVPGYKNFKGDIVPGTNVDPLVNIEIYKNGNLIKNEILTLGNDYSVDPDYEVKVTVTSFMEKNAKEWVLEFYKPWATVSIQTRAKPKLEVTVTTDKTAFTTGGNKDVLAKITVTNNGKARAKNVELQLNIGELKLRGGSESQTHQIYATIEKGKSQSFEVPLVVPDSFSKNSFGLSAQVIGYDIKGLEYRATSGSTSLSISPQQDYVTISKSLKDRIYLQDTVSVKISVMNTGTYKVSNVHVTDYLNEDFELRSTTPLQWDISELEPGKEWVTTYNIRPLETNINGFSVSPATAQFTINGNEKSISSQTNTIIVNGPKLVLSKTIDKSTVNTGEDVTVIVSVSNAGNIGTRIEAKDSLPDGANFIGGSISLDQTFMEPNAIKNFSYKFRMDQEGSAILPRAIANYTGVEYKGLTRSVIKSEALTLYVMGSGKISTQDNLEETSANPITANRETQTTESQETKSTPATPGFEIAFTIIVLMIIVFTRHR